MKRKKDNNPYLFSLPPISSTSPRQAIGVGGPLRLSAMPGDGIGKIVSVVRHQKRKMNLNDRHASFDVSRACIFVGLFHAPFSAFFEVLATSLGRILFRGRISLVNAPKITSDKAFSVKNHVVFSDPPNTDRQIIIFVQNV